MEEERIPKKVLNGKFYATRPVGTPRTRWADVVQRDALQLLGKRGWRKAENRDEWRRLMREAKAWKGLKRQIWIYGWMFVAVGPARNARAPCCHLWPARLYNIFSHYLIKSRIKKISKTKCVLICSTTLVRMMKNSYWPACKVPVILAGFNET